LTFIREIIDGLVKEIKGILREYVHETEAALKKRLQKLLITGIIVSVLVALVISLIGSAALFLLIGQLKYLSTMMPVWEAWDVMGLTSGVIGIVLLVVVFVVIRKQLRTKPN
jgi:di/tricarboxylate transporter